MPLKMDAYTDFLIRNRIIVLVVLAILSVRSICLIPGLQVGMFFSDFYPENDPELEFYHTVSKELGSDEQMIVLAIRSDSGISDPGFLNRVKSFSASMGKAGFIQQVTDITRLKTYDKGFFGILPSPYVRVDSLSAKPVDLSRLQADSFYTSRFFDHGHQLLFLYLTLEAGPGPDGVQEGLSEIRQALELHQLDDYRMLGKKYLESEYRQMVSRELATSVLFSLAIIVVLLFLFFRSFTGILLPVISMVLALVLLYGVIALLGRDLGMMSNLFPTIVLIVGMSDIIHILSGFEEEARSGKGLRDSTKPVILKIGKAIFLTSLTTAIGFLTLNTSSMKAIRDFGNEGAMAVMIAFVFSILWVPLLVHQFRLRIPVRGSGMRKKWDDFAGRISRLAKQRPAAILAASAAILGISMAGIQKLNFNNRQVTNIPIDHQLRSDFRFFNDSLGGSRTFEMILTSDEPGGLRDAELLGKMNTLHQYLEARPDISNVVSPVTWYHLVAGIFDRSITFPELPGQEALDRYIDQVPPEFYPKRWKLVNETETMGRFSGRIKDIGRLRVKDINQEIMAQVSALEFPGSIRARISGSDHLIDRGHAHRLENMVQGLLLALLAVGLVIGLVFRSARLMAVSLVVNLFPLLVVAGVMGFTGVEMRGSTSILFTIGLVIAVDDTIHFLTRYQREIALKQTVAEAVQIAIAKTGKPIVTTSLILIAGFLTLLHSHSWDIRTLGYLVSLMLLAALVTDLLLLPAILLKTAKK